MGGAAPWGPCDHCPGLGDEVGAGGAFPGGGNDQHRHPPGSPGTRNALQLPHGTLCEPNAQPGWWDLVGTRGAAKYSVLPMGSQSGRDVPYLGQWVHSFQDIRELGRAQGRDIGVQHHTNLRNRRSGMFCADEVRRIRSCQPCHHHRVSSLVLPQSQQLAGPDELWDHRRKGGQQLPEPRTMGTHVEQGHVPVSQGSAHVHWGFQLLKRPGKAKRTVFLYEAGRSQGYF